MDLTTDLLPEIAAHAARDYPREACGLVVVVRGRARYLPCRNIAESHEHFVIDPADFAAAEDAGTVALVVHSHPDAAPEPSQADRVGCEQSGLPWLIIGWPSGAVMQCQPSGYEAPLIGRQFSHGLLDCWTLIRDYYRITLGVALPDYHRPDDWWINGQTLYLDHYAEAGFVPVAEPKIHDMLLMQVAAPTPNHAAVWLGDGTILHHQMGRLSSRDVYGGWYRKITTHILRHRSQIA